MIVEVFELQIFLQVDFCQQTSTGRKATSVSVHALWIINRTESSNPTIKSAVWWRLMMMMVLLMSLEENTFA
jgi:hypothetical protein